MESSRSRSYPNSADFLSHYSNLCALHNCYPIQAIRNSVKEGVLNCQVCRLRKGDWMPLLTALKVNQVLHTVVFHRRWDEKGQSLLKGIAPRMRMPVKTLAGTNHPDSDTVHEIAKSVSSCVSISRAAQSLIFEGIHLKLRDVRCLVTGLADNKTLRHISFKGCFVGDRSVQALCQVLKGSESLEWLDLTCCDLTSTGISAVATIIQHQCLKRRSFCWQNSLRGQKPPQYAMKGLHRVTLNLNPNVGDMGAVALVHALQDDLWIKALDLQSCGLTVDSAELFQSLLTTNTSLMVLDLRSNPRIGSEILDAMTHQLTVNMAARDPSEETHRWLEVESARIMHELRSVGVPVHKRKSRRPLASPSPITGLLRGSPLYRPKKIRGIPWRTASRSERWRNHLPNPLTTTQGKPVPGRKSRKSQPAMESRNRSSSTTSDSGTITHGSPGSPSPSSRREEVVVAAGVSLTANQFQELQTEIARCHQQLREKDLVQEEMDTRIRQLEAKNRLLRNEVMEMEEKLTQHHCHAGHRTNLAGTDEETLDAIESSLQQFHRFLDLLREKGHGHFIANLLEES